jgi:hypothetical protein
MDDLDRLYVELVESLRRQQPAALTRSLTVFELHERIVPYRRVRNSIGFSSNDEYEAALSRLLSGERGYLLGDGEMQGNVRAGLEEVLPDIRRYQSFPEHRVSLNPEGIPPPGDIRYAPPELRERAAWATDAVDIGELAPDQDADSANLEEPLAESESPVASPVPDTFDEGAGGGVAHRPSAAELPQETLEHCHACGAELPDSASYCPFCGSPVTIGLCKACGSELEPAWRFCARCGLPREKTGRE